MPRIPLLPGLRTLIPRASLVSRPLLPLTSRLAVAQRPALPIQQRYYPWRMFSFYSPLRSNSPSPPRSPTSPTSPSNHGSGPTPSEGKSFSERLKHLIKTYGWYALGVYFIIGTLDFGVSFAAINFIGAEHVARVTDAVKSHISSLIHSTPPEPGRQEYETAPPYGGGMGLGLGRKESLYAMIVLAWTVHKTLFLPVRVGLTAAFTPRLVNWLTRRGWAGGEGTKRAARQMRERVRRGRDRD